MAEVVIVAAWNGSIDGIPYRLSQKREQLQRVLAARTKEIKKKRGKVPPAYIDSLYISHEKLKQIDRALEGRFNIIIVA